ncbi:hypothetical protein ETD86_13020 [Nonomuraea turkmeniaca]|uniref:Uncharacterized protein n=1 Tax=Nonomuraea turkmeniaca TaxID=103838 RepID=A0A5S4FNR0_9ACTN|nr:hypothetical protein [Nonomuraea turkmeniaca]TMR22084.1 hypothetical protein ETD86_13020 [Nonomuraea turkmeniaca]
MTRTRVRSNLAAAIAAGPARRAAERVTDDLADAARDAAPAAKVWMTTPGDNRPAHADAHGQAVPSNLPFRLKRQVYVRKGRGPGGKALNPAGGWKTIDGWDLAMRPRDPGLPDDQQLGCQCQAVDLPKAIAAGVHAEPVRVSGLRAQAKVRVVFPRVAESEYADQGGGWLAAAAYRVAAQARTRR